MIRFQVRSFPWLALALVATQARAGVIDFPFTSGVCLLPADAYESFADPNTLFVSAPAKSCEKLCSQAAKDCELYVKLASACEKAEVGDTLKYSLTNCSLVGVDVKTCKVNAKTQSVAALGELRSDTKQALDNCDTWLSLCSASCVE